MSTPARIAQKQPDGTYRAITVQYDGHYDPTGLALLKYSPERLSKLIEMGKAINVAQFISAAEMRAAAELGVSIFYNLDAAENDAEREVVKQAQLDFIDKCAREINEDSTHTLQSYAHRVSCFCHRDEGDELYIETHPNLVSMLEPRGFLGVPYVYYHDGNCWFGYYTYGAEGPVPLTDFEALMERYEE